METGIEGMGSVVNSVIDKCAQNKSFIESTDKKLAEMENEMKVNEKKYLNNLQKLQENILDLQCRSMKYNLVFSGLEYQKEENVMDKVRAFIINELEINHYIEFVNVHRFGSPGLNKARPIIARFLYRVDQEAVLKKAYLLKGKRFGINEQFPKAIEDRRKVLYPLMREAKGKGKKVAMVRDRLYIEGKLVKIEEVTIDKWTTREKEYRDVLLEGMVKESPPVPPRQYKRPRNEDHVDVSTDQQTTTACQ
ncbi:hypothetical protein FSP39_022852 [Pinctada imbricata]|uniref:Uncharacterized protein n=1 Tax=Pinctada imbricata TaxID=66713 RepID=A0AA88XK84_PINIB|nr:hypothetical protein FSP39_022852 [Pinctada imbricata]